MEITGVHRLILATIFLTVIINCTIYYGEYCSRKESSFIFASCIQCFEGYRLIDGRCQVCQLGEQSIECKSKKDLYYGTTRGVSLESGFNKEEFEEDGNIIAGNEIFDELFEKIKRQTDDQQAISKFIVLCRKFAETSNYNESCVGFDEFGCTECQDGYTLTRFNNIDVKEGDSEIIEERKQEELNYFRKICIQNSENQEPGNINDEALPKKKMIKDPRNNCLIYSEKQGKCLLCMEDKDLQLNQNGICTFGQPSQQDQILHQNEQEGDNQQIIEENHKLKEQQEELTDELMNNQKREPKKQILSIEKVTLTPKKEGEQLTYKLPIKGEKKPLTIFVIEQKYRNQSKKQKQKSDKVGSSEGQSPDKKAQDEDAYILILIDNNQTEESVSNQEGQQSTSHFIQNVQGVVQAGQNSRISDNQLRKSQQAEQKQSSKGLLSQKQSVTQSVGSPKEVEDQSQQTAKESAQQAKEDAEQSQQTVTYLSQQVTKQSVDQPEQAKKSAGASQQNTKESAASPQQTTKDSVEQPQQGKIIQNSMENEVGEVSLDTSNYDQIKIQQDEPTDKFGGYQYLRDNIAQKFGTKNRYQSYTFKDIGTNSGLFESSYSSFNLFDDKAASAQDPSSQDSNCLLFSKEDPSSCEKCRFLYFISQVSGKCIKADPFCLKFNSSERKCSECKRGFQLQNQRCIRKRF